MKGFPLAIALTATLFSVIPITAQSQSQSTLIAYQCEKNQSLQVTFLPQNDTYPKGAATVKFPDGKTMTLPSVISASGAKYSDGKTTLSTKGDRAFVEVDGKITMDNCVTAQQNASNSSGAANQNLQGTKWKLIQWGTESSPKTPLKDTVISAEFSEDRISGSGSCNRYTGGYQVKDGELSFTGTASTRKACMPEIMTQEFAYFTNLQAAKNYQISEQGQLKIFYLTEQGTGIMVFESESGKQ